MEMLEALNACNDIEIHAVKDEIFSSFGRVLTGYNLEELITFMQEQTQIPQEGNVYVASVEQMEKMQAAEQLRVRMYGGMPIQIGYCNGKNTTYNGFEYHKGSEINIAVTDFMLVLGHTYDICHNRYDVSQATVFFVPKNTAIEMYQTTLHLSPLRVNDAGFQDIVILPRGTNTPLDDAEKKIRDAGIMALEQDACDEEVRLLLQRNKWVIAHPNREPLIRQGAFGGVTGENKELFYPKEQ